MEGKEWVWEGGILREKMAQDLRAEIEIASRQRRLEERKIELFDQFISNL
jgi:hypothetical protein